MTDRPSTAGPMLGATAAGDAGAPGYYPDPSVPGFVRYWAGHAWVPGTSRSAPAPGEHLEPPRFVARYLSPPPWNLPPGLFPAAPAPSPSDTGLVYLDETGAQAVFTMPVHPEDQVALPAQQVQSAPPGAPVGQAAPGDGGQSGELEVRPRGGVAPRRPVDQAPWAVAGNGLKPVAVESWATAAALHLGSGLPEGAATAPRGGRSTGGGPVRGPVHEVDAAVRPLELPGPVEPAPEPPAPPVPSVPRAAQPLGGTPWHGATAAEDGGDGSVGLAAGPAALYEPVGGATERPTAGAPGFDPGPESGADPGSGWRADPREQRGLMETGGAPRWVSWGLEPEAGAVPTPAVEVEVEDGSAAAPAAPEVPEAPEERPEPAAGRGATGRVRVPRPAVEARPGAAAGGRSRGGPGEQRPARPATAGQASVGGQTPAVAGQASAGRTGAAPAARSGARTRRMPVPAPRPAGVGARALAWLVDGAVTAAVGAAVAVPLVGAAAEHVRQKVDRAELAARVTGRQHQVWLLDGAVLGRLGILLGALLVFGLLYQVLPIARTGQTFGKRLARVRVVAAGGSRPPGFGRSLLRWPLRGLGTLLLLLGPLAALLDRPARRGWHDRLARTRVVRAERG
ncbi:RDD family protein [Kitasatospora sp. NPDC088134]|uniref:RDD family protein n=1 Tax=Kitasatospora sp. NPDC088134 TaxID=3364071 RepID=UPI0038045F79